MQTTTRECCQCGQTFDWSAVGSGRKTALCSTICRANRIRARNNAWMKAQWRRKRDDRQVECRECRKCGQRFDLPRRDGAGGKPIYCSTDCRLKANAAISTEKSRAWRAENPERTKQHKKASYARCAEHHKAKAKAWRKKNPDRARATVRSWFAKNPERVRELARVGCATRRARKRALFVERIDHLKVFDRDNGICGICGGGVDRAESWHIDHVVPIAKGGVHAYANVQLSHRTCNKSKGAKLMSEIGPTNPNRLACSGP